LEEEGGIVTAEERSTLVKAIADQVDEVARAQNREPAEVLEEMRKQLLIQRFRHFVSINRAQAEANGWSESDVSSWVDEDRREQRSRQ
jgi:hypothetical protein